MIIAKIIEFKALVNFTNKITSYKNNLKYVIKNHAVGSSPFERKNCLHDP